MKIKIPWFDVTNLLIEQIKKTVEDIREAKNDDNEITREEWRNLLAENLIELTPQLAEVLYKANAKR
jgi:hypothetical protein